MTKIKTKFFCLLLTLEDHQEEQCAVSERLKLS